MTEVKKTSKDVTISKLFEENQLLKKKLEEKSGLYDFLNNNIGPLVEMGTQYFNSNKDVTSGEHKLVFRMSFMAVLLVCVIIGSASWLTYIGKIDGSTFTFLLGLIVGYVLTFIKEGINPDSE